jgi:lysophospholipase L1-like esterase
MRKYLIVLLVVITAFTIPSQKKITVYLIGDSTMSIKQTKFYPETGWGMPFVYFFDSTVTIDNRAQNGRSTRTFMAENRWQPVVDQLQEGDYVFIQFGHNDEVPTKKSYTTEEEFKTNLVKYITETRSKKAQPVLLTPVARRKFDSTGKVVSTHELYSQIVRNVAKENKVPLVDLDAKSQALLQQWGVEKSKLLFNQLAAGEHPNYPKGIEDNTHFNELGARVMAQLVLQGVKELGLELGERIKK